MLEQGATMQRYNSNKHTICSDGSVAGLPQCGVKRPLASAKSKSGLAKACTEASHAGNENQAWPKIASYPLGKRTQETELTQRGENR
jgi:hypothetical protein